MKLIESTHTYVNELKPNMQYISATTLIGKYHEPFDLEYHSARVAARLGKTQDEVKSEWARTNRVANEFGTAFHKVMEDYLLSNKLYIPRNNNEHKMIKSFESLGICKKGVVKPEYIMSYEFDHEVGLAGTSDVIEDVDFYGNGSYDDKRFNVWDFKTNKKFKFETPYQTDWMRFPIAHLSYTHLNAYTLQMSIYALMYEKESGRRCNRMGLLYWDRAAEEFNLINVPYMKMEAQAVIDHFQVKYLSTFKEELAKKSGTVVDYQESEEDRITQNFINL